MAVTIYGVIAVTFMMVMYALEGRGRGFVLAFAAGCLLSSIYGFLSGAWLGAPYTRPRREVHAAQSDESHAETGVVRAGVGAS